MKASIVKPSELGTTEKVLWQKFQLEQPRVRNAFASTEFALSAGVISETARVAVFEDDNNVVGFLPFEKNRFGLGTAICKGANDYQSPIFKPGYAYEAPQLLKAAGLRCWDFDHLVTENETFTPYVRTFHESGVMRIEDSHDAYASRPNEGTFIKGIRRKRRNLVRDFGELRFEFQTKESSVLSTIIEWKSRQYRRSGHADIFKNPRMHELLNNLHDTREQTLSGSLSSLYAGGRLVAAHFGLVCDSNLSIWFPAYNTEFGKYSPGIILMLEMANNARDFGIDAIDFGRGDEEYKKHLQTHTYNVGQGSLYLRDPIVLARRLKQLPVEKAESYILSRPKLRLAVRQSLKKVGSLRERYAH